MKNLIESIKSMYAPQAEATMMKDDGKVVHNCAKHVEHAEYGRGNCIAEEHADPDRYGNIAWYDIEFPHGIEKGVPVSELKILQAESHMHATKKSKKVAEAAPAGSNAAVSIDPKQSIKKAAMDAAMAAANKTATGAGEKDTVKKQGVAEGNDGNLANNAKPYDKVTHGDVIAGRLGKDEMGGKKKKPAVKEDIEQVDELEKKTLKSYIKKATTSADRAWAKADKEEDKAMSTDGEKYPEKQARHNAAAGKHIDTWNKRQSGIKMANSKLKEDIDFEGVDEVVYHAPMEYEIAEADKNYDGYFRAKLKTSGKKISDMTDDEKKNFFNSVDSGFKAKNEEAFVEAFMHSDLADVKNAHRKAGNRISDEKSTTKDGKPHHSYVVTTPEGKRTRHIYHGSSRRVETMSPASKSKEAQSQDLDDKD